MRKISITLDVSKFDKSKITEKKFQKDGVETAVKQYQVDLIELKEPKIVKETDTYIMKKTHFVAEAQTKDERANKKEYNYVGSGFVFEKKEAQSEEQANTFEYPNDDINAEDIPF